MTAGRHRDPTTCSRSWRAPSSARRRWAPSSRGGSSTPPSWRMRPPRVRAF